LGAGRRSRLLSEAVASPVSPIVGRSLPELWADPAFLSESHCAIIAARRPGTELSRLEGPIQAGDVLLVEAMQDFAKDPAAARNFAVVAPVPGSQPLLDRDLDLRRGQLIFVLLLAIIVLAALKVAELIYLVILLCGICIMTGAITPRAAWAAAKGNVFLVIGAAFGVGKAMENSGLAAAVARGVIGLVGTGSAGRVMFAIGFVTAALSNLMSNTATCVLMAPIAKQIIVDSNLEAYTKAIVFTMIYSANASFSTPIATPPNLIVSTAGANYTWMEFLKFGFPLQLIVLPVTVWLLLAMYAP